MTGNVSPDSRASDTIAAVTPGALVTANQATALATVQQLDPIYVDIQQSSADLLKLRQQIMAGQLTRDGNARVKLTLEDGTAYGPEGTLRFADGPDEVHLDSLGRAQLRTDR